MPRGVVRPVRPAAGTRSHAEGARGAFFVLWGAGLLSLASPAWPQRTQPAPSAPASDPKAADPFLQRHYDMAWRMFRRGEPSASEEVLNRILEKNPDFREGYALRALAREAQGDRAGLKSDLRELTQGPAPASGDGWVAGAATHYLAGELDAALEVLASGLKKDPKNAFGHWLKGRSYAAASDDDAALASFTQAARLDPRMPQAFEARAALHLKWGRLGDAARDLKQAAKLAPNYAPAFASMGRLFLQKGDPSRALKFFQKAVGLAPGQPEAYLGRGAAYIALKKEPEALKDFEKAASLSPEDYAPILGRAEAYRLASRSARGADSSKLQEKALDIYEEAARALSRSRQGGAHASRDRILLGDRWMEFKRPKDAAQLYQDAASLGPKAAARAAHLRLANLYEAEDDIEKALIELGKLIQIAPNDLSARVRRGTLLKAAGRNPPALEDFTAAVGLSPSDPTLYAARAEVLMALQKNDEALQDLEKAVQLGPKNAKARHNRGLLRVRHLGDLRAALEDLDEATQLDPNNPQYLFNNASVRMRLGRFQGAMELLEKASQIGASRDLNLLIRAARARTHYLLGNRTQAFRAVEDSLKTYPESGLLYDTRGEFLAKGAQTSLARTDLKKAAKLMRESERPYLHLGLSYAFDGNYGAAAREYREAVSLNPGSVDAHAGLCRSEYLDGSLKAALLACSRAVGVRKDLEEALWVRGLVHLGLKDFEKAQADLSEALSLRERPETYLARSVVRAWLKDFQGSNADFLRAYFLDDDAMEIYPAFGPPKRKGTYVSALNSLETVFASNIQSPHASLCRGNSYFASRYHERAAVEYTAAAEASAPPPEAFINRALAKSHLGQMEDAAVDARRAIDLAPKLPAGYLALSRILTIQRIYDQAVGHAVQAARLAPKDPLPYILAGNIRYFQKNYEKASENFRVARDLGPSLPAAPDSLGLTAFALKKYDEAIEGFSLAIHLEPYRSRYYKHRGSAFANLKDYSNAENDYQAALLFNPDTTKAKEYQNLLDSIRRIKGEE